MIIIEPSPVTSVSLVSSSIPETDGLRDYYSNPALTYNLGDKVRVVNPSVSGAAATICTAGSPAVFNWASHGLVDAIPVLLASTGTLPPGFVAGVLYWIINSVPGTFNLSAKKNGIPLDAASAGTGTLTITAQVHQVFKALQAVPVNTYPLQSITYWQPLGSTNLYSMFDDVNGSQSSAMDSITVVFQGSGRLDSVALKNVSAATVRFQMSTVADGAVYDKTYSMVSSSGINNLYKYFLEPIVRKDECIEIDMQPYNNPLITITLSAPGETVLCGTCKFGKRNDIGESQYGAKIGIIDYSIKAKDAWGHYYFQEGDYSDTGDFTVVVDNAFIGELKRRLAKLRVTPAIYIGSTNFDGLSYYGKFNDFNIVIPGPLTSICTISIESLI
jgi:hypothetical protein